MTVTLTHNIDKIVNRLTKFERTDLPRATRRTINQLGFDLARKDVPQYMNAVFDRPVPFTLKSLQYKVVSNFEVQLTFKQNVGKGNDPARYLYPVTKGQPGNQAYLTKFTRYVHKAGITSKNLFPIPFEQNLSKNRFGNVSQGEYSKVWSGLQTTKGAGKTNRGFRYFSIPDNRGRSRATSRQGSLFDLPKGIYRVKGRGKDGVQLLFTYARQHPTVPQIFDYYGFVEKNIKFKIGPMLSQNLR